MLSQWAKHLMVLWEIDWSVILVAAMNNQTKEMIKSYLLLIKQLHSAGINPTTKFLIMKHQTCKRSMARCLSLYIHQQKMTDRAIQTFKDYFVAIMSMLHASFPMHWIGYTTFKTHAESVVAVKCTTKSQHMPTCMDRMPSIKCHWHHWGVLHKYMRSQMSASHGTHT